MLNAPHPDNKNFYLEAVDCIRGMQALKGSSVDVVVTSPPYNIGVGYKTYKDALPREEYLKWTWRWTAEIARILKPNGSFFLNLGAGTKDPTLLFEIVVGLTRKGFVLQNTIHWIKSISVEETNGKRTTVGPYKPKTSERYISNCHEYIFHLSKHGTVPLDKEAIGIPFKWPPNEQRFKRTVRCRGNTWFIPYRANYNRGASHPAQFPIAVPEYCIKVHGNNTELVVLDPFLGSGASAIAASKCNVKRFIGFDMCQEYVQLAQERVQKLSNPTALLLQSSTP